MLNVIIAVVCALIGLIIGYAVIMMRLKASQDAAEQTLLNAEQEAVNVRSKA